MNHRETSGSASHHSVAAGRRVVRPSRRWAWSCARRRQCLVAPLRPRIARGFRHWPRLRAASHAASTWWPTFSIGGYDPKGGARSAPVADGYRHSW